jgi:Family of unknown function (DUF6459)
MTADACLTDTPVAGRASSRPRLMPARQIDPPYDDEATDPIPAARPTSDGPGCDASAGGSPNAPAAPCKVLASAVPDDVPPAAAPAGSVPAGSVPAGSVPAGAVPAQRQPADRTGHGGQFHHTPGPAAVLIVRAVVETLSGIRTPGQLAGWTTPRLQADLERRMPRGTRPARCAIRSIRVSEPRPGVAEVSAVIVRGARAAALALRMESTDGRWRVTTLQVG